MCTELNSDCKCCLSGTKSQQNKNKSVGDGIGHWMGQYRISILTLRAIFYIFI